MSYSSLTKQWYNSTYSIHYDNMTTYLPFNRVADFIVGQTYANDYAV